MHSRLHPHTHAHRMPLRVLCATLLLLPQFVNGGRGHSLGHSHGHESEDHKSETYVPKCLVEHKNMYTLVCAHVCTHVEGTLFVWFLDLCWVPGMLCIHIYTHTHTHVCKRTYMHCKHINMHIYTRYLHMRIRVRVCDHIRKRVCKYKYPTRNSEFWNPPHIYAGTCAAIPLSLYIHINLVPCSPSLRYTSAYKKIWPSPP